MDCPACRNPMITLELADVEVDHCVNCSGIWLDSGELELLLNDPAKARSLIDSFVEQKPDAEQPRKCPICRRKMAKIVVGRSTPPLLIDKCRRGDGLWFDKNELENILNKAQLDEHSRIQELLADMFGRERPKI